MKISLPRRRLLIASALVPLAASLSPLVAWAGNPALRQQLASLEKQVNGRIGMALLDTDSGRTLSYRGQERFAMCSTFKLLAASAILHRSQQQPDLLQKRLRWQAADAVPYMPITEKHLDDGMTLAGLCAAALQYSDNLAANLLLKELGGPSAITRFTRLLGDTVTRLDRPEPELNTAIPGDPRDTTTPLNMIGNLHQLALGKGLKDREQQQLVSWLKGNTTGKKAILAGLPAGWVVGDKTGSGGYGTTNDVGVLWSPEGKTLVMAVYFTQHDKNATSRQDVLAQVARLTLAALG